MENEMWWLELCCLVVLVLGNTVYRGIIAAIFRARCVPQGCQRCQAISTHTGLTAQAGRLHAQVLQSGRAQSGPIRSTPTLHLIGAKPCRVLNKF